jgi:hypothetical protein
VSLLRPNVIRSDVEGRLDRGRERRYQKRYAKRHGYYWLPCHLCGEEFGGHEHGGMVPTPDPYRSTTICPRCTAERQGRAEEILRQHGLGGSYYGTRWGGDSQGHRLGVDYEPVEVPD